MGTRKKRVKKAPGRKKQAQKKKKTVPLKQLLSVVCAVVVIIGVIVGVSIWRKHKPAEETVVKDYDAVQCITLGKYNGVKVSLKVTDEDIQDEIDSELEDHATYEQLAGVTETGQKIYAVFEGYVNGKKKEDTCGEDYVDLGSGEWLEGFEENLTGVNTGETVNFTCAVPEGTYDDDSIDGKNVDFTVTVQYICGQEVLPEYNDEFVQSISDEYSTTEEFTEHIREDLKKDNEEQKAEYAWTEVVDGSSVKEYPESLMEYSKQEVLQDYYEMALMLGCSKDEVFAQFGYESEQYFIENELESLAKDTAEEYLISEAIAEKEGIAYTEEQYQKFLKDEYSGMTDEYDTIEAYEAEKKEYLERQTLMEQVKLWISDHAEFTE